MKKEMSLAISFKKFFIYNILTFGFYSTFWSYRTFRYLNDHEKELSQKQTGKSGPLIKAIFLIFFVQDLFKLSVLAHKDSKPKHDLSSVNKSALIVVLMILGNFFLNTMENVNPYFLENSAQYVVWLIILLGVAFTLGSFYFFKKPIENFEVYFNEIEKEKDTKARRLHWWEILFSIRGVITWLLLLVALFSAIFL